MLRKHPSMKERLLANSVESLEHSYDGIPCRDWTGVIDRGGYGRVTIRYRRGPRKGKVKSELAHRASVRAFKDRIVGTKDVVMHLCNRRCCIEPLHLLGGRQKQNVRQCVEQGRHKTPFRRSGERFTAEHAT